MKKTGIALLLTSAMVLPVGAEVLNGIWKVSPATPVQAPLVLDSTSIAGKKFTPLNYVNTGNPAVASRDARTTAADTLLRLTRPAKGMTVQTLTTRIRPQGHYAKGTLKVVCPAVFALYVDGKKVADNTSVKAGASASAPLSMEPNADHEIAVRILSSATDSVAPDLRLEWNPEDKYASVPVRMDASMKRLFSLDDTAFGERIGSMSLSPDGAWMLTNYANQYDVDKTLRRTTLTNLKTGKTVKISSGLAWMPTGATLYGYNKGTDGYDLFTMDPATMDRVTVAENLPEIGGVWNRKGDRLYYRVTDKLPLGDGPLHRVASPVARVQGERDGGYLVEYNPATGLSRPVTYGQNAQLADFNPKNDNLLLINMVETPAKRPFFEFTAVELNPQTMAVDTIVPTNGFMTNAMYSPQGDKVLVMGSAALYDGIGKNIGDMPIPNDFDTQAFILNLADRSVKPITRDFDPALTGATWARDGKIYFLAENGFEVSMYAYDPAKDTFTKLPQEYGGIRNFSVADNGSRIAYWGQDVDRAGAGFVYDVRKGTTTKFDDPLAERLADIDFSKTDYWNYTDPEGTKIEGTVTYPPEFDPNKKYPLIVYYYGGTSPTTKGISNPYTPQLFASRGYVVLVLNPSGTTGYGQEFSARHVNAWGKYTAKDIIDATTEFADTHPFVNKEKIGCLGASYGGFMTQYLQTLTPMFAAAVSHAGISDVTSYWGEGWWGYSYNSVAAADSYPWSNPELFTRQGSLWNADKIHTPLLLLHGSADTNVPVGESIQLYNALKILDRPVELITVDGENHFISDYAKRRLWHASIMAWFQRWLQDDPTWWDALYPKN